MERDKIKATIASLIDGKDDCAVRILRGNKVTDALDGRHFQVI